LSHHSTWAAASNLRLNPSKTAEIIFSNKRSNQPPPTLGVTRVTSLKILGVIVDNGLNFTLHIDSVLKSCGQSLFALRTIMRQHGLSEQCLQMVFSSTIISRLLYAAPSFWGFLSMHNRTRLEAFLHRSTKFGYYPLTGPDIATLEAFQEIKLFNSILDNPNHVLHHYLPPKKMGKYNLRHRSHDRVLPLKDDKNFLCRLLFMDMY